MLTSKRALSLAFLAPRQQETKKNRDADDTLSVCLHAQAAEAARKAAEDAAEAAKKNMPSLPSGEAAPAQSGSM